MTLDESYALALGYHQAGRLDEAQALYRQILAQQPDHADALHLLGVTAHQAGRTDEALQLIRRAIAANPRVPDYHNNLGVILQAAATGAAEGSRLDEAIAAYRQALTLNPACTDVHINLGTALRLAARFPEALAAYQEALRLRPDVPEVLAHMGDVLSRLDRFEEAVTACRHAITLKPSLAPAHHNLAGALVQLGRTPEAETAYRRALAINPDLPESLSNLGTLYILLDRPDEALPLLERALALQPQSAATHNSLGNALKEMGRISEAAESYRRAMALQTGGEGARYHSNLLYTLQFHPDITEAAILKESRAWNDRHARPLAASHRPHDNDPAPGRRLRIGYLSPDFRAHPVGRFMLAPLTAHDHTAHEIFCYADNHTTDTITDRLHAAAHHWRPIHSLSDAQVTDLIRHDRIDILIDLTMHMSGSRLLVFARKPAPIQVTYLAYCSTTGLDTIDYRLSDPYLDPPDSDTSIYTEQTMRLPETYWCYSASPDAPPVNDLPALQSNRITFGSLNDFAKISPAALATWAQILRAIPTSHLLLHANPGSHRQRIHQILADHSVDPTRCEFVATIPPTDYFALYHRIDIALDPFPYGGGTTTCDALFMGVPVLTLRGARAVGRGGTSILSNLQLPDWIANSPDDYIRLAVAAASDLPRLQTLRATLRPRLQSSILMDAPRFTRHLESRYRQMWQTWCARGNSR